MKTILFARNAETFIRAKTLERETLKKISAVVYGQFQVSGKHSQFAFVKNCDQKFPLCAFPSNFCVALGNPFFCAAVCAPEKACNLSERANWLFARHLQVIIIENSKVTEGAKDYMTRCK